jgi:hypothetical protein
MQITYRKVYNYFKIGEMALRNHTAEPVSKGIKQPSRDPGTGIFFLSFTPSPAMVPCYPINYGYWDHISGRGWRGKGSTP